MNETGRGQAMRTDNRGCQFSLLVLLLIVLVACVTAAYWGERQRRLAAERSRAEEEAQRQRLIRFKGPAKPPSAFPNADPKLVHIKAISPSVGAPGEPGWAWKMYLPEGDWWLYVSQGEKWDEALGKYPESLSGSQIKVQGEFTIYGCLSTDVVEKSRWIQNWSGNISQAACFSERGHAVLQAQGSVTRTITGADAYVVSPARPAPNARIPLFRWHKVLAPEATAELAKAQPNQDRPLKEYGFSIFLLNESPDPSRAKPPAR